jgi:dolichol-phosphate mannosyltransferase
VKLSVVIPAYNEEGSIAEMVRSVTTRLGAEGVEYEVIVVDDGSTDQTAPIVARLAEEDPDVRYERSPYPPGFGFAVRAGLEAFTGDAVAIMMADLSDDPDDLVSYYRLLEAGYDCAFGSRFIRGGRVVGYPRVKLVINRIVNLGIRLLFAHGYNDTTNAFKAYRREVIHTVQPLLSHHFNLTVELPLKAVVRGHSYAIVPIHWTNRTTGTSKLRLQEMGSRYLFIVLMVFLEHHLSRGDYRRPGLPPRRGRRRATIRERSS